MSKVYLALYKGRKSGRSPKALAMRFADWVIRKATRGQYSHCEIVVEAYRGLFECYSASLRDGGVRCKVMRLPESKWDLIELKNPNQAVSRLNSVYQRTKGAPYDFRGVLGVVLGFGQSDKKWFCSEWCAAVMGFANPSRLSPNDLAVKIKP